VLREELPDQPNGIEGHTDNEPIKASGWKSNWELSTARATSVLHYLVDNKGVSPERVSAIGYGEYRPVISNATAEGRQQNRRVEVVVLPQAARSRDTAGQPSQQQAGGTTEPPTVNYTK
ncbi:MAG: flagellar motor protein MotB, partial [Candidatus Omnitrophica bacterium]|nr:flagellar motor protein MotB [Candidatus Omnitrophota bacterium]